MTSCCNCGYKDESSEFEWWEENYKGKMVKIKNEHGLLKACPKCNSTWLIKEPINEAQQLSDRLFS